MLFQARSRRLLTAGVLLLCSVCASRPAGAQLDGDEPAAEPVADSAALLPHYVLTASVGVPLRLTRRDTFDQRRFAPLFFDALAGYVFASSRGFAHGAGLGFSLNLTEDGGFTEPVGPLQQFVLMPAYLLRAQLHPDLFALGHVGLPISLNAGTSVGLELAAALGYRLLAGFGTYAEAGLDAFGGGDNTLHLGFSLELGVFLDYEVLE